MDKNSKIAFVMPWHISERGGGAEVQANYLSIELARRGFQVSYVCQTINKNKINTVEPIEGVTIYWLKASGRFPIKDQNKYVQPLKEIQPDFIVQRLSSNVTYVLGNYCSKNKCKFIWMCTDNKNPFFGFYTSQFKKRYTTKSLGVLKYFIFLVNNKLMDFYRNKGMSKIDIAFSQNDFQKHHLKRNFNLESQKMISGHPKPERGITTQQRFENKTILWCANFGPHKRPELFIDLANQMLHTPFKFLMVGGHSNGSYVKNLLKDKPANLSITGHLPFDEALSYFDMASVFVSTSVSEGFSNTYIQSWLRSVPVLVFGADPDSIIKNNELGFDVESVNDAVKNIETLLNDFDSYKMIAQNSFNYGNENHSIKKMTDNFLSVVDNEHRPHVN
ncbi:glycosyltransferase family 4 protein [Psychroserpens mesophilus]|uniref:glycosyltransferase family 4 protein n=1 Tax=Psychroserpens mesophilus TaxID=325473 RepID=UPI003D65450D